MTSAPKALDEEGVEPLADRVRDLPRAADRSAGRRTLIYAAVAAAALAFIVLLVSGAFAAESFRRLKGPEITARFTGREFTDGVHWGLTFQNGGRMAAVETAGRGTAVGRSSNPGKWRVRNDELCFKIGTMQERCHEVWVSRQAVQLRMAGHVDEGLLLDAARR